MAKNDAIAASFSPPSTPLPPSTRVPPQPSRSWASPTGRVSDLRARAGGPLTAGAALDARDEGEIATTAAGKIVACTTAETDGLSRG